MHEDPNAHRCPDTYKDMQCVYWREHPGIHSWSPKLAGLDRWVRLRNVVDALRDFDDANEDDVIGGAIVPARAGKFIERKFGSEDA
jgi:hypothetical protein